MRSKQTPINGLKKRSRQSYRDLNACQGVDGLLPTEFSAQNSKLAYPFLDFKKKAREAIISKNGNLCSIKEYRKNPVKRQSTEKDQQSLEEARIYQEMKEKFLVKIKELSSSKIDEVERTKKIPSTLVDGALLKALNRVAGEYANSHHPKNMTDLARILQAVQLCYRDASARPKKPSEWRTNIEIKIQKMSAPPKKKCSDKTIRSRKKGCEESHEGSRLDPR